VATKTPSKGKKAAGGDKVKSAPKKARAQKTAPVEAEDHDPPEPDEDDLDDDEDDDDEEETPRPAAAAATAAPAKKPAAPAKPAAKGAQPGDDPPQVVPARRLTPEAKAKINELVAKGMPLGEALRAAAAWETFVAPVREEPAKLVQGPSFDGGGGGGRPPAAREPREPREPREDDDDEAEEPAGGAGGGDDD
jgi:hypothetical protein